MATNKPRIPVTMDPELFEQVTAYRREHGITSQSKAIQQLVRIGIDSLTGGGSFVGVSPAGVASPGQQAEIASRERPAEFASPGRQAETASRERPAEFASREEQAETASREQSAKFASQEEELLTIARELDPAQKALLLRILRLAGEREETRRTP